MEFFLLFTKHCHALMIEIEQAPYLLLNQALVQDIVIMPCVASPHEYGRSCSILISPGCRAVLHNLGQYLQSILGIAAVLEPPAHMCQCYHCSVLASGPTEASHMLIDEGINKEAQHAPSSGFLLKLTWSLRPMVVGASQDQMN